MSFGSFSFRYFLSGLCAAACIQGASHGAAPAVAGNNEVQIIVRPKARMTEAAMDSLVSANGGRHRRKIRALNARVISVPERAAEKVLAAMRRHADVEYAEPDFKAQALGTANDPYFTSGQQWYLSKIQAPAAWDVTTGAESVVVAIVDSGVSASHPDLAGKVLAGYDFVSNDNDPSDDNGHGTGVAGTMGASSNNGSGVASVTWTNPVLPVKVLGADGSGTYSAITEGITYAADRGARIINLSLGGTASSQALQDAINYAWSKGAVVIAAAGNNGNSTPVYPAACKNVVAVSATTSIDTLPSWSNFGSYVDVSAPGANILSPSIPDTYTSWNGTSFASPITAGVAALIVSANPTLTNQQVVDLLLTNSDDIGTAGYDTQYGFGRVNAYRAVLAAKQVSPADTVAPVSTISAPVNGATVFGTVEVKASATDNVSVSRIELYVNGALFGQISAASGSFPWNTQTAADGAYTLEARAYDAAGNVGKSSVNVNVRNAVAGDTIAPSVAITSPSNGAWLYGRSTKIAVTSSDNIQVKKVELYIDGRLAASTTLAAPTFTWDTRYVAYGLHTITAYAYDAAGNVGASQTVTVRK